MRVDYSPEYAEDWPAISVTPGEGVDLRLAGTSDYLLMPHNPTRLPLAVDFVHEADEVVTVHPTRRLASKGLQVLTHGVGRDGRNTLVVVVTGLRPLRLSPGELVAHAVPAGVGEIDIGSR